MTGNDGKSLHRETAAKGEKVRNSQLQFPVRMMQEIHQHLKPSYTFYRSWCGVHRLDDIGVNRLGDTSAFVNLAGQLL